jgi:hypothetical protein
VQAYGGQSQLQKVRSKGVDNLSIIAKERYVDIQINDQKFAKEIKYKQELTKEVYEKAVEIFVKLGQIQVMIKQTC